LKVPAILEFLGTGTFVARYEHSVATDDERRIGKISYNVRNELMDPGSNRR
jgi:hypothetical protein